MNKTAGTSERGSSRSVGDERRRELVEAAYTVLTEKGFEGFRTRDVADRVGINIATLHYHFATKEDLIRAVAAHLVEVYGKEQAPIVPATACGSEALRELRQLFENSRYWRRQRPQLLTVTREFALRALRDADLHRVLGHNHHAWRTFVEGVFAKGVADGTFRADLDANASATILMSFLYGASPLLDVDEPAFADGCAQFERLVRADGGGR